MAVLDYRYSIQLFFDHDTEKAVTSIINRLRDAGVVNGKFVGEHYRPHVSLAVYKSLDQAHARHATQVVATQFAPFRLTVSHIGVFNEEVKALYLGPVVTAGLRALHVALHKHYSGRPEVCWNYYLPDHWTPHCGLLIDTSEGPIVEGVRLLMGTRLPDLVVESIAAVGFPDPVWYPFAGRQGA